MRLSQLLVLTLILLNSLTGCSSNSNPQNEERYSYEGFDFLTLDYRISSREYLSVEFAYPSHWQMVKESSSTTNFSEIRDSVTDGFANNFHILAYSDTLNVDLITYSNLFFKKEVDSFEGYTFKELKNDILTSKNGIEFSVKDYTFSSEPDVFFVQTYIAKADEFIIHLNFYCDTGDINEQRRLSDKVIESIQVEY